MQKKSRVKAHSEQINCIWGLLCSLSSEDQQRHNISLFNVIDQFSLPHEAFEEQSLQKKPLVSPTVYEIVLCWRRLLNIDFSEEEIKREIRIKTLDPSGKILQETISPLIFPKKIQIMRFRIILGGLIFTTPGDYSHSIEVKLPNSEEFKKAIEIPFSIKEIQNLPIKIIQQEK